MTLHAEGTPVCSFQSSAKVHIESLKAYFAPKQEGSGDPSPSNVRPISGWTGLNVYINDISIPAEYARLDYLNINNGNWIDSNYVPTVAPKIEAKFQLLTNADEDIFGFANNTSPSFIVDPSGYGNNWFDRWGATGYTLMGRNIEGKIVNCTFGKNTVIDGVAQTAFPDVDWSTNQQSLKIGAARNNGSVMNLYECKIYDGTTLVRSMIPCKRISDSELGLYDIVNNTFYTKSGSGTFVAGPEVQRATTIPVTFPVLGKNKFDKNAITDYCRINGSGEITLQSGMSVSDYIPVVPSQQYTITTTGDISGNKRHAYYDENKQYLRVLSSNPTTITIPEDAYYIRLTLYDDALDTTQFELGDTATTYEAYNPDNTVYGGYVDLAKGELVQTHCKLVFDGTEYIYNIFSGPNDDSIRIRYNSNDNPKILRAPLRSAQTDDSGKFSQGYYSTEALTVMHVNKATVSDNNGRTATWVALFLPINIYVSSLDDVRNYIKTQYNNGTPLEVCYPLATPIHYPLTSTVINALRGQNHIWSSATDKVEVDYDLHETKEIATAKRRIAANTPHIETVTNSITTFNTDMRAALQSCKVEFTPVQNLNGYDKPWVGGSGKNILKPTLTSGTTNGITYTVGDDGSVTLSNTSTLLVEKVIGTCNLVSGQQYRINGCNYGSSNDIRLQLKYGSSSSLAMQYNGNDVIYTAANTGEHTISFVVVPNITADITLYPMVRDVSITDATFAPYENVCPISGWTGIDYYHTNKRLYKCESGTINGNTGEELEGFSAMRTSGYITVTPLHTYTFNVICNSRNVHLLRLYMYNSSNQILEYSGKLYTESFTTLIGTVHGTQDLKIRFSIKADNGGDFTLSDILNTVIEVTDTSSVYSSSIPVSLDWTNEAGTIYGGYVDLVSGEVWKTYHKIVADGTNVIANSSYLTNNYVAAGIVYLNPVGRHTTNSSLINVFTDSIPIYDQNYYNNYSSSISYPFATCTNAGNQYIVFFIGSRSDYPDVTDATTCKAAVNAWLQQNPVTIVYELKTPTLVTTLTPTQLKTLVGINNIWSNANGTITTQYWKH